jgi:hypothetical protein
VPEIATRALASWKSKVNTAANEFQVPENADSPAGAKFFEQHYRDLTWSIGYEIVVQDIESFTASISAEIRKSANQPPPGMTREKYLEATALAARAIEHKGTFARTVATRNAATILETILCKYVDNFPVLSCRLTDSTLPRVSRRINGFRRVHSSSRRFSA